MILPLIPERHRPHLRLTTPLSLSATHPTGQPKVALQDSVQDNPFNGTQGGICVKILGSKTALWFSVLAGLAVLLLMMLLASLLSIGSSLRSISPFAEYFLYALAGLTTTFLIILPILSLLRTPSLNPYGSIASADLKELKRFAAGLASSGAISEARAKELREAIRMGRDLRPLLKEIEKEQIKGLDEIVKSRAKLVFLSTAISQNGRLDALLVLIHSFQMVKMMVDHMGYRPSIRQMIRVYTEVLMAALIANTVEELALSEVIAGTLIDIEGRALQVVASSAIQGVGNAFFTLRVGLITKYYLQSSNGEFDRNASRIKAVKEAARMIGSIVKDSVTFFPRSVGSAFVNTVRDKGRYILGRISRSSTASATEDLD